MLYTTIFFAPFTASAVINVDPVTLGVQPAYYVGGLYIVRFIVDICIGSDSYRLSGTRLGAVVPFWLFTMVALLSIFAIPFSERTIVRLPSNEYEILSFRMQNITQFAYLFFVTAFMSCLSFESIGEEEVEKAVRVIMLSAVFVCFWGWVEAGSILFGYEYPSFVFNNSVSFAQQFGGAFGGLSMPRISSVTPEPSMFARFLLAPTFISLYDYYHKNLYFRSTTVLGIFSFFVTTIFASASSTGYVGLAIGLVITYIGIQAEDVRGWFHPVVLGRALQILVAGLGLLMLMAVVVVVTASQVLSLSLTEMVQLFEMLILDKIQSGSGQERLGAAVRALELLSENPFFGVGWGSNRTFDLATHVFAATGVIGGSLFFFSHYKIGRQAAKLGTKLYTQMGLRKGVKLRSLILGFSVLMVGKLISEPDIVYMDQWVFVGLSISFYSYLKKSMSFA